MPTLSEATRTVYRRRKNGTKSATNFLIGMKHNIKALGDLPVNKITRPMVNKMMDILKQERKNSNAVVKFFDEFLQIEDVLREKEHGNKASDTTMGHLRRIKYKLDQWFEPHKEQE